MDWIDDAAKELASHFSFGSGFGRDNYVTNEQRTNVANNYAKIIRNHEPVAPRCDACHWWGKPFLGDQLGSCYLIHDDMKLEFDGSADVTLKTAAHFGCVQWKPHV